MQNWYQDGQCMTGDRHHAIDREKEIRGDILQNILSASRLLLLERRNRCRPSVLLRPELLSHLDYNDYVIYVARYGSLYASGSTPEEAFTNFDEAWVFGI